MDLKCEITGQAPGYLTAFVVVTVCLETILGRFARLRIIPFGSILGAFAWLIKVILCRGKQTRENKGEEIT